MEHDIIKQHEIITDFTDQNFNGCGLSTASWSCFHRQADTEIGFSLLDYSEQFDIDTDNGKPLVITLELDMTQIDNDNGVLTYIIHNKPKDDSQGIRTDGIYTNVGSTNIDISKRYRLAVAISRYDSCNKIVEIID